MGQRTKISWCDATWNPVTGCLHGCEYCYARRIAERFSCEWQTLDAPCELQRVWLEDGGAALRQNSCHYLRYPVYLKDSGRQCVYPFGFMPTFHRYRLDEPQKWKKPKNIFVCSMADLFGDWVPDEWIQQVFNACEAAPQHKYIFLTKNPKRYKELMNKGIVLPNYIDWWFGYSMDGVRPFDMTSVPVGIRSFVSIEPIRARLTSVELNLASKTGWIIVGAETGNRKEKAIPEKEWIDEIAGMAAKTYTPLFMKESLRELMGKDFRQEFPWFLG